MYLSYDDIEKLTQAYDRARERRGHHESIRALLHEAGFILQGDILNGEPISTPPRGVPHHYLGRHITLS